MGYFWGIGCGAGKRANLKSLGRRIYWRRIFPGFYRYKNTWDDFWKCRELTIFDLCIFGNKSRLWLASGRLEEAGWKVFETLVQLLANHLKLFSEDVGSANTGKVNGEIFLSLFHIVGA